ncbi:TPA: UvrD-helicase domain-containing protein [Klebsiella pneumoniae]|uniref:UvrD-helicase domain-containing protein n=1 Tax=Klebsiella pneumoniae TaxID=573 RepID=UPI001090E51E|nr:UvrD-helicase domain-containing protein [Klebsiella pneumoniae]EKU7932963.1 UvrD-helicase domain-containing protein [Klebsiella pneumoniae]VGH56958.1 Superfamily I DNA and RNA helicases [Klebsiella pneumoniae]HBQ2778641.1 UvrD-helicase domain-containing protein [Klebsiella pneumoniae]HBQ2782640.1 UvrD-helicase domain-containing protein [Klebsiella pneumoniae]
MENNIIVLDEGAINLLERAIINEEWFNDLKIPSSYRSTLCSLKYNGINYILSKKASVESKYLVIKTGEQSGFWGLVGKDLIYSFERCLSFAVRHFNKDSINGRHWGMYKDGNIISFYATPRHADDSIRLYFDIYPMDTKNIYLYNATAKFPRDPEESTEDEFFLDAISGVNVAIGKCTYPNAENKNNEVNFGIELTEQIDDDFYYNYSFQQWYDNKLTTEQRNFVDKDYSDPVRLRGAAGTGKTIAMVIKLIKDSYSFENLGKVKRFLFLTHSHSTSDLVNNMISSLDKENNIRNLKNVKIKICSLYDLTQEILNYNHKNIHPISTDGKEGRENQYEIVSELINECVKDLMFRTSIINKCSAGLQEKIINNEKRHFTCIEILNEFACILDAENIYLGSENSKDYLHGNRESWQMDLNTIEDRLLLLNLHNVYREKLKELNALSMDQMIADLSNYLHSHIWNRISETEGYDAIFVDELHYFTKPERMVFNDLCRSRHTNGRYPIFMAYDIKQSMSDVFLNSIRNESIANVFKSTGVGASELVELTKVFRYSPEIAAFLTDLDGAFPALDLSSEWNKLNLSSENAKGDVPIIYSFANDIDLVDGIFQEASRLARKDKSKSVAILCLNLKIFSKYLNVGRIRPYHEPLTSRDEIFKPIKFKGKCLFSMPEYVAGMQFDTVYLIHIDKNELPDEITHSGIYRRFVSQIYLGASRAKERLILASSNERRGMSPILKSAITNGTLELHSHGGN